MRRRTKKKKEKKIVKDSCLKKKADSERQKIIHFLHINYKDYKKVYLLLIIHADYTKIQNLPHELNILPTSSYIGFKLYDDANHPFCTFGSRLYEKSC